MDKSRRSFLKKSSLFAIAGLSTQFISNQLVMASLPGHSTSIFEPFTLPKLPYEYSSLEPHIDGLTMEIHHTKHHQAYVNNLNKAMTDGGYSASLDDLVRSISKYSSAIRNNGGGHWNHSFFWKTMKPQGGGLPNGKIETAINGSFGSFEEFKTKMEEAGLKRFGSGWAWLVLDANKKLVIGSTPNQDNPLMDNSEFKGTPILGVDVWEHAYYLKYQNKRGDYLKAWWNLLNWEEINRNLELAEK